MATGTKSLRQLLGPLRPFATSLSRVNFQDGQMYSCFLSASFVRAFEFAEVASKLEPQGAFFFAPALRGITEDLIYLKFLSNIRHDTREQILGTMMMLEAIKEAETQVQFFKRFRPFQPVLGPPTANAAELKKQLKALWQNNGLPNTNRLPPSTSAIAKATGSFSLNVLYEFLYRFTSTMVHFNPQVLLSSGWGPSPERIKFSTRNRDEYYLDVCQVYGSYLLCIYFEFFEESFRLNQNEELAVNKLREFLLMLPSWPEILKHEVMNFEAPTVDFLPATVHQMAIGAIMEDGFISGSERIASLTDSSRTRSRREV